MLASGIGWGISLFGVFLPEAAMIRWLSELADVKFQNESLLFDPVILYWIRMASIAFSLIGMFFITMAIAPQKYNNVILLSGLFNIVIGITLLIHGFILDLSYPVILDVSFCLGTGIGITGLKLNIKSFPIKST